MPVYWEKKRGCYRYEFDRFIAGRRHRATKVLPKAWDRDKAEAYAQKQDAHLYAIATGALKQDPLISDAVLLYLTEHLCNLKSFTVTKRELAKVAKAIEGKRMNELASVADKYATDNAGKLAPATIRNRIAYLRAACRWAWKRKGMGSSDPSARLVLPSVKNERHTYITEDQLHTLVGHVQDDEARAVITVAFYSGMRLSEIMRAVPTQKGWLLEDTKNGERRIVPIHPATKDLTKMWPISICLRTVQKHHERARKNCGLEHVRFHDLRHSAASAMANAGADLYAVGRVLGHKSHASTRRYSHLATDTLANVVSMIGKKRVGES